MHLKISPYGQARQILQKALIKIVTAGLVFGAVLLAGTLAAQEESSTRSVEGVVTDPQGRPVEGAVVKLKNLKNLQVRSFITDKDGRYRFHGLNKNTDYELIAEHGDLKSPRRRVSVFDTRDRVVVNLQLEPPQQEGRGS